MNWFSRMASRISAPRYLGPLFILALLAVMAVSPSTGTAAVTLTNPSFETGNLSGWSAAGGSVSVVTSYGSYLPKHGQYFARLYASCPTTTLSQNFTASAGDQIDGWAFFKAEDYLPFNDNAQVLILQGGVILFNSSVGAVGNYGGTPWTHWQYTLPTSGTFTLQGRVSNVGDCALASVLGMDAHLSSGPPPDTTPPTVTGSASPAPNGNGWNNTNVTASFSATDNAGGSGVKEIMYSVNGGPAVTTAGSSASTTLTADGTYNITYYAKDNAGNTSATKSLPTIKIDKTAPTIAGSRAPAANANGWNNANVTVSFSCSDGGSGIASCSSPTTLTAEGAGQSASGTATDLAGNSASTTVGGINIDKTAPTITGSRAPLANANGWNNTNVTVSFSCADSLSGVGSCSSPTTLTGEGANQSVTGSVTDKAGNSASATVGGINIDKTAPTITGSRAPLANANGWNNTNVTVSFSCADSLSGVDSCSSPTTLTGEGANQSVTGTVTDKAGNSASATVGSISIDKTVPVTTATQTPPANGNGWNSTTVSVALSCTDNLSGCNGTEYNLDGGGWTAYTTPVVVSAEGIHTLQYRSKDKADNLEAAKSLTIKIDKTAPEAYNQFNPVTRDIDIYGRDGGSGVPTGPCTPTVTPIVGDDDNEGMTELRTCTFTDAAGNTLKIVEKVRIDHDDQGKDHTSKATIVSLQYNGGPVITPPANKKQFDLEANENGTLKSLQQKLSVGKGASRNWVKADYNAKKNQTVIKSGTGEEDDEGASKQVKPGLVLLRLATSNGSLVIEY